MAELELDPRWEWVCVPDLGGTEFYVRGRCRHTEVIPVACVSGELVARLCLTCDQQWTVPLELRWLRPDGSSK